jgi:hypothetical protein
MSKHRRHWDEAACNFPKSELRDIPPDVSLREWAAEVGAYRTCIVLECGLSTAQSAIAVLQRRRDPLRGATMGTLMRAAAAPTGRRQPRPLRSGHPDDPLVGARPKRPWEKGPLREQLLMTPAH